jgi:uncharacterized protein involved in exopolysaccharide biosynthesis
MRNDRPGLTHPAGGGRPPRGVRHEAAAGMPHVRDYLRILYRRRWIAAAAVTTVLAATAVYTFTRVPLYQAQATILIESDTRGSATSASTRSPSGTATRWGRPTTTSSTRTAPRRSPRRPG